MNPALCAMTTTELRSAVASGKVSRDTRAWRVGLEAWAKLPEIPEIAGAFEASEPEAPSETAATPPAVEIVALPQAEEGARSPQPPQARVIPLVPVRPRRRAAARAREVLFEARWAFAGAAVAAASIGLSLMGATPTSPLLEARASASGDVGRVVAGAALSVERRALSREAASKAAAATTIKAEAGQRRMRSSSLGRANTRGYGGRPQNR